MATRKLFKTRFLLLPLTLMLFVLLSGSLSWMLAQSSDPADDPAGDSAGEGITPENAADVRYIDNLKQASQEQTGLVWSPQGRQLAIAGAGGIWIYEWTAEGRHLVRLLETKLQMEGLAYSSDGSLLIASRQGEALTWLWDVETGSVAATFQLGGVLGFIADDSLIVLHTDHGVDLWGIPGGEVITQENAYRLKYIDSIKATEDRIKPGLLQIALSPDGHSIAFVYQHDFQDKPYTVSQWDITTRQPIWTQEFGADEQAGTGATINNKLVTFTPDSQQIAVYQGNKDKTISLFNADDGSVAAVLESDPGEISAMSMAFTPDGRVLAVAAFIAHSAEDHEFVLDLWDVEHQTLARRLDNVVSLYSDLAFSSDGTLLAGIFPYIPHVTHAFGLGKKIVNLDDLPTPTPTTPPNAVPTEIPVLHIGGTALTQTTEGDTLNMRSGAGRSFEIVARLPTDVTVTILDGPQEADGYRWWQIRTTNNVEGWVVDEVDGIQTLIPQP